MKKTKKPKTPPPRMVTVTMTETHARAVARACDLYARVAMGQWEDVAREVDWPDPACMHAIADILRDIAVGFYTRLGRNASYGIMSQEVSDQARAAADAGKAIEVAFHDPNVPSEGTHWCVNCEPWFCRTTMPVPVVKIDEATA